MLVPYYLMSAYLYEEKNRAVLTDSQFDAICKRLDKEWDKVQHRHKYLIERDSLSSSTCGYIKDYPMMVKCTAMSWIYECGEPRFLQ